MYKTKYDDGFHDYLVEGAQFTGNPPMPALMDLKNTQVPKSIIPFDMAKHTDNKRQYVHFYIHDNRFIGAITATKKYINLLKEFDGVITPDCSMLINQQEYLQQTNTYFNRAVGFYLQKQGIPVIPNVRWSDESSFKYCFNGIPENSIVSISTHGCIHRKEQRIMMKTGLDAMLNCICPCDVLVHGRMPDEIFGDYLKYTRFHQYPSQFEQAHQKGR